MIRRAAGGLRADDVGRRYADSLAAEDFVERADWQPRRKRAEFAWRRRDLPQLETRQISGGERIAPIVRVAGDDRGEAVAFGKKPVGEQVGDLPLAFALGESEVPIDEMDGSEWRVDDDDLSAAGLFLPATQRNMMPVAKRPAGEEQIAISADLPMDVHLKRRAGELEMVGEQLGLIVIPRPACAVGDLLQADQVRLLAIDDLDDPVKPVSTVAAADALVNVVGQQSHGWLAGK